jgi:hypothetical protein
MNDQPVDLDQAMQEKWRKQQAEADALLADPNVHTPTLDPDANDAA